MIGIPAASVSSTVATSSVATTVIESTITSSTIAPVAATAISTIAAHSLWTDCFTTITNCTAGKIVIFATWTNPVATILIGISTASAIRPTVMSSTVITTVTTAVISSTVTTTVIESAVASIATTRVISAVTTVVAFLAFISRTDFYILPDHFFRSYSSSKRNKMYHGVADMSNYTVNFTDPIISLIHDV